MRAARADRAPGFLRKVTRRKFQLKTTCPLRARPAAAATCNATIIIAADSITSIDHRRCRDMSEPGQRRRAVKSTADGLPQARSQPPAPRTRSTISVIMHTCNDRSTTYTPIRSPFQIDPDVRRKFKTSLISHQLTNSAA